MEFITDNKSSNSNINEEDSDYDINEVNEVLSNLLVPPSRRAHYNKLNTAEIKETILNGELDNYVLDIYSSHHHSDRHRAFFSKNIEDTLFLDRKSYFGPFKKKSERDALVDYFVELFKTKNGERVFIIPYVMSVWIPEAIVKAISIVEKVSFKDAMIMFDSDYEMKNDVEAIYV